ncbi:HAMP domain-containing histidine kinase [Brevibacillus humidisoli]|uniref:sensor histidine kinase n=1 Tax=Brevibacillus humidisoli TaxID=2895522 RepID=UPI001E2DFDC4|nr:HAMP domain-containing sensor histidine kinase [Brevibacillus humidisoli]UFJ40336.1 HAMP domain-containing histidine kinase [Brevibacillus humidisoli]
MAHDKWIVLTLLQSFLIAGLFIVQVNDHSLGIAQAALFAALFALTAMLLVARIHFLSALKSMVAALRRAIQGNVNTRLLADHGRWFNEVIFAINELIEQTAKIQVQTVKSEAARKSLLANISHDIRTPVTSIIGYVDALKDGIAISDEERREYLEILSRKALSLKDLIDEIFEMAKLDADDISFKLESLDFAELTRESVIEFLPEMKKQGINLNAAIPDTKCHIVADRLSMLRIIRNLLKNALQHGKDGKVVGVELIETATDYQLSIWDKGAGISEDDLPHVFERMYRTDRSRSSSQGGSGLGLAIAKALVEKNRGAIWVESNPGTRTSFRCSIPKATLQNQRLRNR